MKRSATHADFVVERRSLQEIQQTFAPHVHVPIGMIFGAGPVGLTAAAAEEVLGAHLRGT